jgi:hypothetical protein
MTVSFQPEIERGVSSSSRSSFFTVKRLSGEITPKLAVIRPELAALTGNPLIALTLNQLLYWTERLPDFDQLVREELAPKSAGPPCYGWFYKSSEELAEETLLYVDRTTIRRYLSFLIEQGWVSERSNPGYKWNKTTHYRVNIRQLCLDLRAIGYDLPGFPLEEFQDLKRSLPAADNSLYSSEQNTHSNGQFAHTPSKHQQISNGQNAQSSGEIVRSNGQNVTFERAECPLIYLTEITTETTNRENAERARENLEILEEEKKENVEPSSSPHLFLDDLSTEASAKVELMVKVWEKLVASSTHLTRKRKQKLATILETHFQNDVRDWDLFCQRIKASSFLMGEGSKGWRVNIDWILVEENLIKVFEGNFDNPGAQKHALDLQVIQSQEKRTQEILGSIEDPIWRGWCTQFTQGSFSREPLSYLELEGIANAHFLEVENERLVWIGSNDPKVLGKIENLRIPLSSIASMGFPKPRTIRTRLIEASPQLSTKSISTSERTEL